MFNLYQIVQGAQGGQAITNLAKQFDLSSEEAGRAVNSLIPALSTGFFAKAGQPGGSAEIFAAMNDDHHKKVYENSAAAADPVTRNKGEAIVASLFATNDIAAQVAEQASRFCGVPAAKLLGILPVLASIIVGGTAVAIQSQGFGGLAGQFAGLAGKMNPGAFTGTGLGNTAANPFAGFTAGAAGGTPGFAPPGGLQNGVVPPAIQASLDAFAKMFQSTAEHGPRGGKRS
jgi:hypothetical protein